MNNVYLFQPQYSVEVRKEENYWLPYSVGCLWSYCSQFDDVIDNYQLKRLIFKREDPDELVAGLDNPFLCAFSCFIWNEQYNLHVAQKVKQAYPNCVIEFGGPQASKSMLDKHDFIDCVMLGGDGEENFLDLLRLLYKEEEYPRLYERSRMTNLDMPSPYQVGIFDTIVAENPDVTWASMLESNRGCPHRCTYCDWGGTTYGKVQQFGLERVIEDIDWMVNNRVGYIFLTDANFGMFGERDIYLAGLLREAGQNPKSRIDDIVIQYSKNSNENVFKVAEALGEFCKRGITISAQSMNQPTLKAVKRKNLSIKNYAQHMELAKKYKVRTYTEMILGLPEETLESWKEGFATILENGQHESIDIWFCQVFGNTELNSALSREVYGIETVKAEDYLSFTNTKHSNITEIVEIINKTNTMSTEDIVEAYLYSWMIVQFHINGFSQLISKYYRNIKNISYREFYDKLFEHVKNDSKLFGNHYHSLYNRLYEYMSTGKVTYDGDTGHSLELSMAHDFNVFWDNKQYVFDLIRSCWDVPEDIFTIQKQFVYDPDKEYPYELESSVDFESGEQGKIRYNLCNGRSEEDRYNMWAIKRQGLDKNTMVRL
jgi:radical SAM superfamily enzyme YgiQ (UPF0313 family)